MKKLIALMLSLMLLVSVALPVMAEAAGNKQVIAYDDTMSIEVVIPEGFTMEETTSGGAVFMVLVPENQSENYYCTVIAPDEDRADIERLNDLSDEELQAIAAEFCDGLNNPVVSFAETGLGTKLIVINDNDVEAGDTAVVSTLYKGFFLTTYVFPAGESVTEEEMNVAIQFYTDMEFKF